MYVIPEIKVDDSLEHYGVKGMKWGVRKSEYKKMTKEQRKAQKKKYFSTPEGKIERNTRIATIIAGPIGGVIVGGITLKRLNKNTKVSKIKSKTIKKGKKAANSYLQNKSTETDEQRIMRLSKEGKLDLDSWEYLFDQNGRLFYASPKYNK